MNHNVIVTIIQSSHVGDSFCQQDVWLYIWSDNYWPLSSNLFLSVSSFETDLLSWKLRRDFEFMRETCDWQCDQEKLQKTFLALLILHSFCFSIAYHAAPLLCL